MAATIHLTADFANQATLQNILEATDLLVVLPEIMTEGPLQDASGSMSFDDLRVQFRKSIQENTQSNIPIEEKGNVATLLDVSQLLSNQKYESVCIWMSDNAIDLIAYYFMLHFLRSHYEKIAVINIAGLPFLDEDLKLFFPKKIGELSTTQLEKALKLKRNITPSEMEIEGEEWKILRQAQGFIRIKDGNKKLKTVPEDFFDDVLKTSHKEGARFSRTIQQLLNKNDLCLSPDFLAYRLTKLFPQNITENKE